TPTATATATPSPLLILAGAGEPGYAVNIFGPNAVTVGQGSIVTFKGGWLEPHTVSMVPAGQAPPAIGSPAEDIPSNPGSIPAIDGTKFVNSGLLFQTVPPGAPFLPQFQASFPNLGTFPLVCLLHPGMGVNV